MLKFYNGRLIPLSQQSTGKALAYDGQIWPPFAPGGSLVERQVQAPVSWKRCFLKGAALNISSTIPAGRAGEPACSWLAGIARDAVIPADWHGGLLVTKEAVLPVDFTLLLYRDGTMDLDWLKGLIKDSGLAVEVAGRAVRVEMLRFYPKIPRMKAVFRLKDSQVN